MLAFFLYKLNERILYHHVALMFAKRHSRHLGFTLVELIIVIILLAIVSVYAASRFYGIDSISATVAREQAISVIRQIQLTRMQNNIPDLSSYCSDNGAANAALRQQCQRSRLVIQSGCLGSMAACSTSSERSDAVILSGLTFSATPALTSVDFDLLGNPLNSAASGVTITLRAPDSVASLCINGQGYVAGSCP